MWVSLKKRQMKLFIVPLLMIPFNPQIDIRVLISGLANDVEQRLYGVQETLIAALTGVAPGTLEAYYAPAENENPYALTDTSQRSI